MATKAIKRARRRARISLHGSAPIEQRPTGRDRRHTNQPQEPADKVALTARMRHAGLDDMREARSPLHGCSAGKAIHANVKMERDRGDYWDAVQHIRQVIAGYDRATGAPNRFAQSIRILLPPETFEATADTPPLDDRSDIERAQSAILAWGRLYDALGATYAATVAAVVDDAPVKSWPALRASLDLVVSMRRGR